MGNCAFCSSTVCPKATLQPAGDNELFDDVSACDPAGTVFSETLEDLNEVDRLLLLFSSSSNLSAVRWLFVLGANPDACDTNGTTCLHAACRSGSLPVVQELLSRNLPLDAADVAGWTPLHVALFMGRRGVATELMHRGADLTQRNTRGLAPADLCSDVWLREAIHSCASHRQTFGVQRRWDFNRESDIGEDVQISSKLRFEPFFVPRTAVIKDLPKTGAVQSIGVDIFNQRPGQGLAFLVAAGVVRDFPVELSGFLSEHPVSLAQIGEFLGEDFSLSQTLRLEYINSVRLMGTGVVSCLAKVFKQFHVPSDMQKIDRLLDGVAQIWWRQHEQLREKEGQPPEPPEQILLQEDGEVEGVRLMRQLRNYDSMHRLLFSAVMLHWNLHAALPPSQRVSMEDWIAMNDDIDSCGRKADFGNSVVLRHIQSLIYGVLSDKFFPELQIWQKRPARPTSPHDGAAQQAEAAAGDQRQGGAEGWAMLVGGGFPSFAGLSGTITYRHIRSILSETTSSAFTLATPNVSRQDPEAVRAVDVHGARGTALRSAGKPLRESSVAAHALPFGAFGHADPAVHSARQDWAWLSLREDMLFLAPSPARWAPYAFIHLRGVAVTSIDTATCTVTLGADVLAVTPTPSDPRSRQVGLRCNGGVPLSELPPGEADSPSLQLVFLLPDGRWQILELPRLRLQVLDLKQLDTWRQALAAHCAFPEEGEAFRELAKRATAQGGSAPASQAQA